MRNLFKMKLRHTDCYLHKRLTKYFTRENISKLTWKGPLQWKKKMFCIYGFTRSRKGSFVFASHEWCSREAVESRGVCCPRGIKCSLHLCSGREARLYCASYMLLTLRLSVKNCFMKTFCYCKGCFSIIPRPMFVYTRSYIGTMGFLITVEMKCALNVRHATKEMFLVT